MAVDSKICCRSLRNHPVTAIEFLNGCIYMFVLLLLCFDSDEHIAVGDQMFWGMQDFDFCPNIIKYFPKFYPNSAKTGLNFAKFAKKIR